MYSNILLTLSLRALDLILAAKLWQTSIRRLHLSSVGNQNGPPNMLRQVLWQHPPPDGAGAVPEGDTEGLIPQCWVRKVSRHHETIVLAKAQAHRSITVR